MISSHASQPGILCAGSIVLDTIVRSFDELRWGTTTFIDSIERHPGGNGANTARALAILGNRVRLTGAVGSDDAGAFVLEQLRSDGVDIEALGQVDEANAASVILVNSQGDRQFLHRLGSSNEAFRESLDFTRELINGVQHFHLASLFVLPHLRGRAPEILRRARNAGLTTSLDVNWDPYGEWLSVLEPCLPDVDMLFLNEDESRMMTGMSDPMRAAHYLQDRGARTVLQKLSAEGCRIFTVDQSVNEICCPPFKVHAVDSTGAGDCFAAGFLSVYLRGGSLEEAGNFANAAGARSVSAIGSVAGLLPEFELRRWMENQKGATTE